VLFGEGMRTPEAAKLRRGSVERGRAQVLALSTPEWKSTQCAIPHP